MVATGRSERTIKAINMNPNGVAHRSEFSWRNKTSVKAMIAAIVACVLLAPGCAQNTDTGTSKGSTVAGPTAPATQQPTADENRAKAMESIDNNSSMTPEQKAAMKKQFEVMGKKR